MSCKVDIVAHFESGMEVCNGGSYAARNKTCATGSQSMNKRVCGTGTYKPVTDKPCKPKRTRVIHTNCCHEVIL